MCLCFAIVVRCCSVLCVLLVFVDRCLLCVGVVCWCCLLIVLVIACCSLCAVRCWFVVVGCLLVIVLSSVAVVVCCVVITYCLLIVCLFVVVGDSAVYCDRLRFVVMCCLPLWCSVSAVCRLLIWCVLIIVVLSLCCCGLLFDCWLAFAFSVVVCCVLLLVCDHVRCSSFGAVCKVCVLLYLLCVAVVLLCLFVVVVCWCCSLWLSGARWPFVFVLCLLPGIGLRCLSLASLFGWCCCRCVLAGVAAFLLSLFVVSLFVVVVV